MRGCGSANIPYAKELASLGLPKRALVSSSAANVEMSFGDAQEVRPMTTTKPDVDLTDGAFYAGDSRSVYKWMRENEPVFRDRNGLAAAATYQAVIEAERQSRAVLQRWRHPARPAMPCR